MSHRRRRMLRAATVVAASVMAGLVVSSLLLWATFDTEYSAGFTRRLWKKTAVGMSETEVKSLLGEPLSEVLWANSEGKTLNYSQSRSGNGNYVHHYIVIRDARVVEKRKVIFWD